VKCILVTVLQLVAEIWLGPVRAIDGAGKQRVDFLAGTGKNVDGSATTILYLWWCFVINNVQSSKCIGMSVVMICCSW